MKSWSKFFSGIFAISLFIGCSNDNMNNDESRRNPNAPKEAVYMKVSVTLPSAPQTRSTTTAKGSSSGTEAGKDSENNIKKILLVLAKTDNSYITHGIVENLSTPSNQTTVSTTAKFDQTDIQYLYDQEGNLTGDNQIHVYAFCNPTNNLVKMVEDLESGDKKWFDHTCHVVEGSNTDENNEIWQNSSFLMSNAEIAQKTIPNTFNEWVVKYASEVTPFDLSSDNNGGIDNRGAIPVERSVARFDFKDGSPGDNTYPVGIGDDVNKLQVQLVRMALTNMSNEFYYLKRVSNTGLNTNSNLCGKERPDNYVVDTDAEFKKKDFTDQAIISQLSDHFNFRLFDNKGQINDNTRNQWDNYWINDITNNNPEDIDEGWGTDIADKTGYHIWRYVTENTIPADNNNQRASVSTGVIFKGKLLTGNLDTESKLYKAIKGTYQLPAGKEGYTYKIEGSIYPILYSFQNQLYTGWNDEVLTAAQQDTQSSLHKAALTENEYGNPNLLYEELVNTLATNDQQKINEALSKFRKAAITAGFTLYQASNDADGITGNKHSGVGYYFYYYYWNRHNDNNQLGNMGAMEFGVVRNNVYKLAVTGISKLGHPRITDNDPDPVDPDDPDENGENGDIYMAVSIRVLPWVVRVNNIEF